MHKNLTVGQLRELLGKYDENTLVLFSSDEEGNTLHPWVEVNMTSTCQTYPDGFVGDTDTCLRCNNVDCVCCDGSHEAKLVFYPLQSPEDIA